MECGGVEVIIATENKPVQRLTIGNNAQELQGTSCFKVMLKNFIYHYHKSPIIMKEDMEYETFIIKLIENCPFSYSMMKYLVKQLKVLRLKSFVIGSCLLNSQV